MGTKDPGFAEAESKRAVQMDEASIDFPAAAATDSSDVAVSLETATALWRRGDQHEAIRWIRRAAETADTDGDDLRAVALARAAAELQDRIGPASVAQPAPVSIAQPAPVSIAQPAPVSIAQPAPVSIAQPSLAGAASRAAVSVNDVTTSAPPEQPAPVEPRPPELAQADSGLTAPSSREAQPPAAPPSPREPAPAAAVTSESASAGAVAPTAMPAAASPAAPATGSPPSLAPAAKRPPPAPSAAARGPVPTAGPNSSRPPSPSHATQPIRTRGQQLSRRLDGMVLRAPGAPDQRSDPRTGFRVAVERSADRPDVLVVRFLSDGERPPIGAREAIIVPLEPGVDLRFL